MPRVVLIKPKETNMRGFLPKRIVARLSREHSFVIMLVLIPSEKLPKISDPEGRKKSNQLKAQCEEAAGQ